MLKACSKCGRIHDSNFVCKQVKVYSGGEERKLRSSNKWKEKSIEVREKANYLCEVCKDAGVITYQDIEVHHIEKVSERPDLLLDNFNAVVLCQKHHKEADSGRISKEYLKELARRREDK